MHAHTLVWHLQGQQSQGECPGKGGEELPQVVGPSLWPWLISATHSYITTLTPPPHSVPSVTPKTPLNRTPRSQQAEAALEPGCLGSNPDSAAYHLSDFGQVF